MTGDRGFGRGQHPEELLSASVGGDLTAAERAQLDAHLADCTRCRATLEAFAEERRLIGGLQAAPPPRDLAARVRAGIEGRRPASLPWWRRPGPLVGAFATLTTVTAALLAIVVFSNLDGGPVANDPSPTGTPVASQDIAPTATLLPSIEPTPSPAPSSPPVALEPGQIGYLQLDGEPQAPLALSFVNDATGEVTDLGTASAAPWTAAISPTNEFVAYTVDIGLSGAQQLRVTRLSDGMTEVLGCTVPRAFADRLVWSDDGRFLAYTLTPLDLGESVDCGGVTGDGTRSDAWAYDAGATAAATQLTDDGNSFAADIQVYTVPGRDGADEVRYALMVSHADATPWTELVGVDGMVFDQEPLQNVFLPLLSPDGSRALFWRGEMGQAADGGWHFVRGGMPYRSGEPVDGYPSWSGEPLFVDLEPVGGAGFESGQLGWSPDGTLVGFWLGEWTGAPQSADGTYPSSRHVYAGRLAEGLSQESRVGLELEELQSVVDVTLDSGSGKALVTVVQPSAGDLSVPASTLYAVPIDSGVAVILGTGASWTGPAVIGLEARPVAP
jgi:predicted anti-sigma-YlaC factor YlaD